MKKIFLLLLIFPIYFNGFSQNIASKKSGTIDVGVTQIIKPTDTVNNFQDTVMVYIKNYGTDTISSIPIEHSLNGMNIVQETWTGTTPLLPGDSVLYMFTTPFIPPLGWFMLCAKTNLQNDLDSSNDKSCKAIYHPIPLIIYDLGVSAIIKPDNNQQFGSNGTVKVAVKNYGNQIHSTALYYYKINNNPTVTEYAFTPPNIYPGDTIEYTFYTHFTWPLGNVSLCAWVDVDSYNSNDSACIQLTGTPPNIDVGISGIEQPIDTIDAYTNTEVKVWLKNFGLNSIDTILLQYSIDGVYAPVEVWSDSSIVFGNGDSVLFTFANTFNSVQKNISLCVKTILPNDSYNNNDSLCDNSIVAVINGIEENKNRNFRIIQNYPNPSDNISTIQYYVPGSGIMQFELYDILGNRLISFPKTVAAGENQISIDISSLLPGMYFYSLEFEKNKFMKKMIVK